jgi:hypothetical protein
MNIYINNLNNKDMFFLFLITWVVSIKDLDPDRYHTTVAKHDCVVFFSDFSSRA